MCYPDATKHVIILEWKNSDNFSSYILAHEIGHSLGLEHDFFEVSKGLVIKSTPNQNLATHFLNSAILIQSS